MIRSMQGSNFTAVLLAAMGPFCALAQQTQGVPQFTISTVAGNGKALYSGDGGPAINAGMQAGAVAADAAGNLFVADGENQRVRKVAPNGIVTTFAGSGAAGFSGDGGPATKATMNGPERVA